MNKITILSEFQKEFRKALEKTSFKEIIIDNEIKEIDNFLKQCGEKLTLNRGNFFKKKNNQ